MSDSEFVRVHELFGWFYYWFRILEIQQLIVDVNVEYIDLQLPLHLCLSFNVASNYFT